MAMMLLGLGSGASGFFDKISGTVLLAVPLLLLNFRLICAIIVLRQYRTKPHFKIMIMKKEYYTW